MRIRSGNKIASLSLNSRDDDVQTHGTRKSRFLGGHQELKRRALVGDCNFDLGKSINKSSLDRLKSRFPHSSNAVEADEKQKTSQPQERGWKYDENQCRERKIRENKPAFQPNYGVANYQWGNWQNLAYSNNSPPNYFWGRNQVTGGGVVSHPAPGTTIEVNGNQKTIYMKNRYYGDGATPNNIWLINRVIENYWSGTWTDGRGHYINVRARVDASNDQYGVNYIRLDSALHRSYVVPGGESSWSTHPYAPQSSWAHEAGHLLGFSDHYIQGQYGNTIPLPGHEHDLMATLDPSARVTYEEVQALGGVNVA